MMALVIGQALESGHDLGLPNHPGMDRPDDLVDIVHPLERVSRPALFPRAYLVNLG